MYDKRVLEEIARTTGVFNAQELAVLAEILESHEKAPGIDYVVMVEGPRDNIEGFIVFGRTPLTRSGWDIYWLVVRPECHRQGVGSRLLRSAEQYMLSMDGAGTVIRIETSTRQDYEHARRFYASHGYSETGRIDHFYKDNDGLVMFSKLIDGSVVPETVSPPADTRPAIL